MSEAAEKPAQIDQLDSVQDIERLLLASAGAIQRLVAERNALCRRTQGNRIAALESEKDLPPIVQRRLGHNPDLDRPDQPPPVGKTIDADVIGASDVEGAGADTHKEGFSLLNRPVA